MQNLFTPLSVKNLTLKNRIIMPPMATAKANGDGTMSKEILEYYHEKTKDEYLSMVIVEHSFISEQGRANKGQLSVSKDAHIEGLKSLADLLRKNNTVSCLQINHAGIYARPLDSFMLPIGPSPSPTKTVKVMTREAIGLLIKEFAEAARRTKEAGFDAVEIHSAHGYLLNQFYSPLCNKRTDSYGGSLHNRMRLHIEILEAVRAAVGEDYPIFLRLGASDYKEGGVTLTESIQAAKIFQEKGLDLLDVSGGFAGYTHPEDLQQGYFKELTSALKAHLSIPVILTGGITDLQAADQIIREEQTDLVGIGRAIYKDSNFLENALKELEA